MMRETTSPKRTGRPKGTGRLGLSEHGVDHMQITVRIPMDLYKRLEAFAKGRTSGRGTPERARCVREAIAHYLECEKTQR